MVAFAYNAGVVFNKIKIVSETDLISMQKLAMELYDQQMKKFKYRIRLYPLYTQYTTLSLPNHSLPI